MTLLVKTTRFTRSRLPHWEVENARYFVTVRCADSLPHHIVQRLRDVHEQLQSVEAASRDFAQLQRQYFRTMDKYLDQGIGEAPLRSANAARALVDAMSSIARHGVLIQNLTIMPNHWHALLEPVPGTSIDLIRTMTRLKGASARAINLALGRRGSLWQREWFDRWIRDEAEWERCRAYIRMNPVKAGLVAHWEDHPWTFSLAAGYRASRSAG